MRRFLQRVGTIVFFCAWPAFFVYFKVGHGRTRVVVMHEGKVLAMREWISPGKWHLPGGGLHKGEDPAEGAVRELREETSLELDPRQLQPLGTATFRAYGLSYEYFIFLAKVGSRNVRAQRIEVSELDWLAPDRLTAVNALPDTLDALRIARDQSVLVQ